jgi:hypothetical protein
MQGSRHEPGGQPGCGGAWLAAARSRQTGRTTPTAAAAGAVAAAANHDAVPAADDDSCFRLRIGAITVGVLDLYRDRPGDLTAGQLATALMAADEAALALLYLGSGDHGAFADDMDGHAAHQMHVHQATGMVKVQLGVTIEEAFLMLRAHAFAAGRPVAEVARDVIERRLRFSTEDR